MAFAPAVWLAIQSEFMDDDDDYDHRNDHDGSDKPKAHCSFDLMDDDELFTTFHLTRPCIKFIVDNIRLRLKGTKYKLKPSVSVEGMVMTTLNYFAHGVLSIAVKERVGISHVDTPEIIRTISNVLSNMATQFITFPFSREDKARLAQKMEAFCGIPDVLGVVACGHFKVRAPYSERELFLNSMGSTTVMTQFISDYEGNIMSVDNCYVGSTREYLIWESSFKGREMDVDLNGGGWVLGGKGYYLTKHILTAVTPPTTAQEAFFNEGHTKALEAVQRMYNCMKHRFRCLAHLGFAQKNALDKKFDIITACCVLHNIAKKFSVPSLSMAGRLEHLYPCQPRPMPPVSISPDLGLARQFIISATRRVPASVWPDSANRAKEQKRGPRWRPKSIEASVTVNV